MCDFMCDPFTSEIPLFTNSCEILSHMKFHLCNFIYIKSFNMWNFTFYFMKSFKSHMKLRFYVTLCEILSHVKFHFLLHVKSFAYEISLVTSYKILSHMKINFTFYFICNFMRNPFTWEISLVMCNFVWNPFTCEISLVISCEILSHVKFHL